MMTTTKTVQCVLIAALFAPPAAFAASAQSKEESRQYSDTAVAARIKAVYAKNEELNGSGIQIRSTKGAVRLGGFAQSQEDADRATALAKGVKGVVTVRNEIQIRTSTVVR
jgi:osmotically-inducible protein OsmY